MSRVIKVQTNFAVGEINPELRGRIDLRQYESALERARNVICKPQGSIERRPGLKFLFEIPSAAAPQSGTRLVAFQFSTTQTYMLTFSGTRMFVHREGVQVTDINGSGNDFLDVSSSVSGVTDGITSARLANLWYTQSADTLLLFEETMLPLQIVRGNDHNIWTVSDLAFDFIPKFAFTITESTPTGTVTPSAVDGNITLTASASIFHDGDTGTAQAGSANTITLRSGASSTDDIFIGSTVKITGGTGSGQSKIITDYVGSTKVATVNSNWSTNPDNTSTYSVSSVVNQFIENTNNFGRARIISFTSATVVEASVEIPFFNTSAIASGDYILESGHEDAWSIDRGWPRTASFHEGRLLLGGSKSLPTTIWGSRVAQFFNFDPGQALDDEGLEATIDTDQVNAIVGVFSGRDFQVFTTGTEFVVPQLDGEPLTPLNFIFKPSTRRGSEEGIRPVSTEGGTLYVQRGGKAIREFIFSDLEGSFISNDISMLSSHLLQSPSRMAMRRGTNVDEGDLLHIVNGGDGSMAAFSILRSQNVIAPSLLTTEGTFLDVSVEDADEPIVYAVVKRQLPAQATCTITVADASAVQAGDTITFFDNAGTQITLTATTDDPPTGETETSLGFSVGGGRTANGIADNIAVGTGGVKGINALAGFSAPNPAANVITVTRVVPGNNNLTVTSSRPAAITVTNFTGGETDVHFLEVFDSDFTTDSALQFTAAAGNLPGSTTVSGLGHLQNVLVKVIADDAMLTDQTVTSSAITTDRTATTFLEIGREFPTFADALAGSTKTTPLARTMPVETRLPQGPILGNRKRVVKVSAVLDNTQSLTVNGTEVPFRAFGSDLLDEGVSKFTGTKQIGPFLGYDFKGQVEITQEDPLFMTLLALDYRVSVSPGD